MKLWQKSTDALELVTRFTAGADARMDEFLVRHDLVGSMAHIIMLEKVGLLTASELQRLLAELRSMHKSASEGAFQMEDGIEDIHSQVEPELTRRLGDDGKKVHSGRSRNDQVLVDLKLFFREELQSTVNHIKEVFTLMVELSDKYRSVLLPGYTHFQLAMPSSFGLWFAAYAESLADDLLPLQAAWRYANRNPLGSAAGYGSSFPLDRELTTALLGFEGMHVNVVNAQMSRGKTEKLVAQALAHVAATMGRMAMDACLYLNPNFGFISFPAELTTGSSIMPHKKNPDVFEIIRARCNQLQALPGEIGQIMANLPSGYHRDLQVVKEMLFPAFGTLRDCLTMTHLMLSNISVRENILTEDRYRFLFSVEEVNRLVLSGMPFRDAYRKVGADIESGKFKTSGTVNHTHAGSIGDPGTDRIRKYFETELSGFDFESVNRAVDALVSGKA